MNIKKKISSLISILKETEIDEIEISSFWGAQKIRVSNKKKYFNDAINLQSLQSTSVNSIDVPIEKELNKKIDEDLKTNANLIKIKAPLVGTYYSSSKPGAAPFIKIGDKIIKGQTICIIEAMKIFNEIESDYNGTVVDILIEDGTPVEYDHDLIIIQ